MNIIELDTLAEHRDTIETLLVECVNDGASIGFLAPFSQQDSSDYWASVESDLRGRRTDSTRATQFLRFPRLGASPRDKLVWGTFVMLCTWRVAVPIGTMSNA